MDGWSSNWNFFAVGPWNWFNRIKGIVWRKRLIYGAKAKRGDGRCQHYEEKHHLIDVLVSWNCVIRVYWLDSEKLQTICLHVVSQKISNLSRTQLRCSVFPKTNLNLLFCSGLHLRTKLRVVLHHRWRVGIDVLDRCLQDKFPERKIGKSSE